MRSAAQFSDAAHARSQVFDATIDDHLREFVWNDTLYHERRWSSIVGSNT